VPGFHSRQVRLHQAHRSRNVQVGESGEVFGGDLLQRSLSDRAGVMNHGGNLKLARQVAGYLGSRSGVRQINLDLPHSRYRSVRALKIQRDHLVARGYESPAGRGADS